MLSDIIEQLEFNTTLLASLSILLGCCYFFALHQSKRARHNLPPCPARPWPLVGNIFNMDEDIRTLFKTWHKQCGDIFSIYFGNTLVVVVGGFSSVKEMFVQKGAVTSDRPDVFFNKCLGMGDIGIAFSSGPRWKELRSTTHQILKEFGMGTNTLAERIREEVNCYVNKLADLQGEPTDIQHFTHVSVSNVICSIAIGRRFSHEDPRYKRAVENLANVAKCAKGAAVINFLPFLQHLPGDIFKAREIKKRWNEVKNLFVEIVSEIENKEPVVVEDDSIGNFIFSYRRKQKQKIKSGKKTFLDDANLIKTIIDLFAAGTETVASTIVWCVLYILCNPGVQVKIHEELDRELGLEKLPTMDDEVRLPYLGAVIKETQRFASLLPSSVLHKTCEDVTIGNYFIPKGTSVIPDLDSVLHDPKIWGNDAEKFNPERFLCDDGSVLQKEEFIPFSIGGRICVGEALAKMELFLFLSSMFQRFEFVLPDPANPPSLKPIIGITAVASPYKVSCVDRLKKVEIY
ncbi:cytochrome p450 ii f2-like protein ii [Plakobranchus ocellatus]|uniref:Cytochrome p450 ii f2-like protein ii n=1 Tax=Plakobranchus ocellatus TaxID=259542 RepID=A0AAV4AT75_9GAST|nr:cytochrome p450 ii f2-like protein ii [Plakobranchus ocellatus]